MADYTKSQGQSLDWTLLDDYASDEPTVDTGVLAFADNVEVTLHLVVAHIDVVDAAASSVIIRVFVRAGGDAEGWREWVSFQSGGGQATSEGLDDTTSGATIPVDATTDWDDADCQGKTLFLKDVGTLVDSCLVQLKGWTDGVSYTAMDNMVNTYDNSDELYDGVKEHPVNIPAGAANVRVTFTNTHATATYAVRVDYTTVTDIV